MGNLLSKGIEAEEQRTGRNKETQIKAINELQKNFDIIFKEVVAL